ncbi:MAG: ATP-binding protein [Acidimicrobiia bacterium]|nr:ATP-binding protein [Acidimicrobiia bacterium]
MSASLLPRHASISLDAALEAVRVTLIHGPRQAGKTTLARLTTARIGGTFVTLDDPALLNAARNDPVGFVAQPLPLVIDEIQRAGDPLVRAIKLAVDLDPAPGRFLITGSTNFLTVPTLSESLAGRVGIIELWPFSQGELARRGPETFTRLAFEDPDALRAGPPGTHTRDQYLELICAGGYPATRDLSSAQRRRWHRDYVDTVTRRDIVELADIRRADAIAPVLSAVAALTGQELNITRLARGVGLDARTVATYLAWLDTVFLVHRVPQWSRNLSNKAAKAAKLYLSDSGLAATLTNKDPAALARPPDTSVGQLVETFAANEIAKQLTWDDSGARLHHFRDRNGPEIDLILERPDGRIVAIEVKAAVSPGPTTFRWLTWLRDRLDRIGTDFVHGFVLHTGPHRLSLGDRLTLLPLDVLWTPTGGLGQDQ